MALPPELAQPLRELVSKLVTGDFAGLEEHVGPGSLSTDDLKQVISGYGRRLAEIPEAALDEAVAIPIMVGPEPAWRIDLDLWTAEEGQSDLTLSVTMRLTSHGIMTEIDDLHVM